MTKIPQDTPWMTSRVLRRPVKLCMHTRLPRTPRTPHPEPFQSSLHTSPGDNEHRG